MPTFKELPSEDDIKEVLKRAFDADLDISGAWGYTQDKATNIGSAEATVAQLEHMLGSMRSYIEMNMTLSEEERYGSINLIERNREEHLTELAHYDKVTYEITAIKESRYNAFIKEYKEHYGKEDFDLTAHFEARKKETLKREATYWFKLSFKNK